MLIEPHRHRIPPKPPWFRGTKRGTCQWCQKPILPGQRPRPNACLWHTECLLHYRRIFDWPYVRNMVFKRDNKLCQECGDDLFLKDFETDHIKPLFVWPKQDITMLTFQNLDLWYSPWQMQNLNTLCPSCHRNKTIAERKSRPIMKRRFAWQRFI